MAARKPTKAQAARMRKRRNLLFGLLLVLALAIAAFLWLAPGTVERSMNRIEGSGLWRVSDEAKAMHETLFVADLHADTLLWKRDMTVRSDRGHVDLERLAEGNVALQVFASVTKTPRGQNYDANSGESDNITALVVAQGQPVRTWNSLLQRSLYHAEKMAAAEGDPLGFMIVRTRSDLERLERLRADNGPQMIGALLAIEGLHNIEGRIANLDRLIDAGYRMAGLTHFFDNELAGSMHGMEKGGLTPLGRQAVRRMEARGVLVDAAHLSRAGLVELIDMAERPIVYSHGGVKAICDVNRNLSDIEIRGIASTGGLIGIGFWDGAVCSPTPAATARAMRHVRDLVGIEHVALGSDFDGAITAGFDASQMAAMTQALMDQGFTAREIRAAMGENIQRLLMEVLPEG